MDNDLISRAAIIREIERIRKSTKTLTGIDFLWMIETDNVGNDLSIMELLKVAMDAGNRVSVYAAGDEELPF